MRVVAVRLCRTRALLRLSLGRPTACGALPVCAGVACTGTDVATGAGAVSWGTALSAVALDALTSADVGATAGDGRGASVGAVVLSGAGSSAGAGDSLVSEESPASAET